MCHSPDNSLEQNLAAQAEMLRRGIVTPERARGLTADAENAERIYRAAMEKAGWTAEDLFRIAGYRILTPL